MEDVKQKTKPKKTKKTLKKTTHFARQWFYIGTSSIFFLVLCDVFMWVWLDFYFLEVDRAELCAATAGPRGNLDWSRLGSFSPEIFCAATLLKRNLTWLTKRKQHKTNTLDTPKKCHLQKKNRVKAGSRFFYTDFFLLMVSEIPKPTKSKTQVTEKNRSLDVFWISLGLLNGYDKYQELSFPTDCGEILERYLFVKRKCITPPWPSCPAKISIL